MEGTTTLTLRKDRIAKFGTGETGVWGVKSRPKLPAVKGRGGRGVNTNAKEGVNNGGDDNYDGSFDSGVCLEIEVTEVSETDSWGVIVCVCVGGGNMVCVYIVIPRSHPPPLPRPPQRCQSGAVRIQTVTKFGSQQAASLPECPGRRR